MVVIVWLLDLQLPVQAVPITTKVVSLNRDHGEVYSIQLCDFRQVGGFLHTPNYTPNLNLTYHWASIVVLQNTGPETLT